MRSNVATRSYARTHEGAAVTTAPNAIEQLRRSVQACLLFEKTFYEDGQSISDRIVAAVHAAPIDAVLELAAEVRYAHNLRHAPLWMIVAALSHPHRDQISRAQLVAAINRVCKRPDDMTELLALYWPGQHDRKAARKPLPAALKIGLAQAFARFDAYQLAKYAQRGDIRLRDVLRLVHPCPSTPAQSQTWKHLIAGTLSSPDTWEVALSAGDDKAATLTRLLNEDRLGGLATLRNLRNMRQAGVDRQLVQRALLRQAGKSGILPYQYIAAARMVPEWEDMIEAAMMAALQGLPRLPGRTLLFVDTSGSMKYPLYKAHPGRGGETSNPLLRSDAAAGLAILLRETCDDVVVACFDQEVRIMPARHGFALRDLLVARNAGTDIGMAVRSANQSGADRIIIITDEQSATSVPAPVGRGYIMNVASYEHGVGYRSWTHVTGFSEHLVRYIVAREQGFAAAAIQR